MRITVLRFLEILATITTATVAYAQEAPRPVHHQSTVPPNARYEVIQSSLAARLTFRLDRYTGRVWQLVKTKEDEMAWEEMRVLESQKLPAATRPRFQLFTSGFAVRHTFLLDADTGGCWQLVTSKRKSSDGTEREETVWQPFAE